MDKFFAHKIVKNKKGQSVVEYILLLSVIAGLGATVLNNKKLKLFLAGQDGLFARMKKEMAYSYRYGRAYREADVDFASAMSFDYSSSKHDTYTVGGAKTHFFMGEKPYPQ